MHTGALVRWQQVFLSSVLGVMVVDQLSKSLAASNGAGLLLNTGISFGWFTESVTVPLLFAVLIGIIIGLSFHYWPRFPLAFGLFFGGVMSNVLDRMIHGGVRDWLPVPFFELYNNFADWAIVIGIIILIQQTVSQSKTNS